MLRKKNPYLFRAKNILTAQELVTSFLDARLSSSEEEIFGDFMEDLAIYIAQKKLAASKSSSDGIDFHYRKGKEIFVISIKSGLNWGNSSQWKALESDFKKAQRVLLQSSHVNKVHCMLGVCYGKAKKTLKKGFIAQICGQEFWHMVSGSPSFYKDIIEPLGHHAKELNENFKERKARLINKLTKEFLNDFCTNDGTILWDKVVEYNSGNMKK
ncbi:TPA: cytosolic protein [Candidatus Woesearchaeota archaeon]|nr:cytosolic protein [Candidatus Woesearchaeota archaeon]HIH91750.1 cytosolic protein [Candidatus Woesearchaeota archaeon]HIJ19102.1 cytosolic protein [Candidatus Woesearchaeota archaeon]